MTFFGAIEGPCFTGHLPFPNLLAIIVISPVKSPTGVTAAELQNGLLPAHAVSGGEPVRNHGSRRGKNRKHRRTPAPASGASRRVRFEPRQLATIAGGRIDRGPGQRSRPERSHEAAVKVSFGCTTWTAQLGTGEVLARVFPSLTDASAVPTRTVVGLAVQASPGAAMNLLADPAPNRVPPIEIRATRQGIDGTHAAVMVQTTPNLLGFGPSALTGRLEHPAPTPTSSAAPTSGHYTIHLGDALYELVDEAGVRGSLREHGRERERSGA